MSDNNSDDMTREKLAGLMEMVALVNSSHKRSVIINHAINSICRLTLAEVGSLLLVDDFTGHLEFNVVTGGQSEVLQYFRVPKGQGIAGWVFENDTPLIVPDVQNDERFYNYVDEALKFITREMIAVPLRSSGKVIGVMQVINKKNGKFNHDDLKLAMAFANQIAEVIHKTGKEAEK